MRLGKGLGAEFNTVPYIWLTRESIWYISKWRTAHTHTHYIVWSVKSTSDGPGGSAVYGVGQHLFDCWDRGFESR